MKNKKNTKIILIICLNIVLFTSVYFFNSKLFQPSPTPSLSMDEANTNVINVSLEVLGKSYQTEVREEGTVYDFMKSLNDDKKNNFNFNYKEYPSLGIFVDGINGVKNEPNKYWIYYVNGKEAEVGVSNYILKDGDEILWKQE